MFFLISVKQKKNTTQINKNAPKYTNDYKLQLTAKLQHLE